MANKGGSQDEASIGGGPAGAAYRKAQHKEDPNADAMRARRRAISEENDKHESARHEERLRATAARDKQRAKDR